MFHNSNVFGSCIVHILYTECAKFKKNQFRRQKVKLLPLYMAVVFPMPLHGYIYMYYIFIHLDFGCTDELIMFGGRSGFFLCERKEVVQASDAAVSL